jgi:formylglycine-generating enzyme required for sulfatase activity
MLSRRSLLLAAFSPARRDMARIPGGTFRMGSDEKALLREFPGAGEGLKSMLLSETPAHDVSILPFWIDRCEVTNAEFRKFTHARPGWSKERVGGSYLRHWERDRFPEGQAHFPVTFVTWEAAAAYAEWAGKRLPTEAEWEFAARGGLDNPRYPWGDQDPSPRRANYRQSGMHGPVAVGAYPSNPYGLFDLAGNVWEFCLDEWTDRYPPDPQRQTEEDLRRLRATRAGRRVIRGGSFGGDAFNLRVTARDSHRVDNPVAHVGFRCARSLAGPSG